MQPFTARCWSVRKTTATAQTAAQHQTLRKVDGEVMGEIANGLVLLLGIKQGDTMEQVDQLAKKVLRMRLWPDPANPSKQWASSVSDNEYGLLVVSQFTLFATFKRKKPDFKAAMGGDRARVLYEAFVDRCRAALGPERVATGVFGAMMQVRLCNEGPVTVELEAEPAPAPAGAEAGPPAAPQQGAGGGGGHPGRPLRGLASAAPALGLLGALAPAMRLVAGRAPAAPWRPRRAGTALRRLSYMDHNSRSVYHEINHVLCRLRSRMRPVYAELSGPKSGRPGRPAPRPALARAACCPAAGSPGRALLGRVGAVALGR